MIIKPCTSYFMLVRYNFNIKNIVAICLFLLASIFLPNVILADPNMERSNAVVAGSVAATNLNKSMVKPRSTKINSAQINPTETNTTKIHNVNLIKSDQPKGKKVTIRVRTINAISTSVPSDPHARQEVLKQDIDTRLVDLQNKFIGLPYDSFKLRSSERVEVPLRKKATLKLPDGHILNFRVLYRNDNRIGLWVDWLDGLGMMVLNSKVHLSCKESFLAGTDNVTGGGLLLAVATED